MNVSSMFVAQGPSRLAKLRDLLALLALFREITDPITSPQGLRQALAVLIRFAEMLGIDDAWLDRVRSIVLDDAVFNIVLAIVQYLAGVATRNEAGEVHALGEAGQEIVIDAQSFLEWLPLVVQLLALLGQMGGDR